MHARSLDTRASETQARERINIGEILAVRLRGRERGSGCIALSGIGCRHERIEHILADFERRGPDRRTQVRMQRGRACARRARRRAAAVFSTMPAASPRQPACAAPTARPASSQNSTGRQSATITTHTAPGRSVTLASARTGSAAASVDHRAGFLNVGAMNLLEPRGGRHAPVSSSTRRRFSRTASSESPVCRPRFRPPPTRPPATAVWRHADAAVARRNQRSHARRHAPLGPQAIIPGECGIGVAHVAHSSSSS